MSLRTLIRRPLLGLLIASAGVGALALTMLLSNKMKTMGVLDKLTLEDRPEIQEDEIKPVEKKDEPKQDQGGGGQTPPPPPDSNGSQDTEDTDDDDDDSDSSDSDSSDSDNGEPKEPSNDGGPQQPQPSPDGAPAPGGNPPPEGGEGAQSDPSSSSSMSQEDLEKIIRETIKEINNNDWLERGNELAGTYSAISRVEKLAEALDAFKKQLAKKKQEQK